MAFTGDRSASPLGTQEAHLLHDEGSANEDTGHDGEDQADDPAWTRRVSVVCALGLARYAFAKAMQRTTNLNEAG
jgi:hypothetical protein